MRDLLARSQHLAARALGNVMLGIVAEATQRNRALDRLGLGRNERVDTAPLEPAIDLAIGITGIGGCRVDTPTVMAAAASMRSSTTCPR